MFEFLVGTLPCNKYLSKKIRERDGVNLLYFQNKNILKDYQVDNLRYMSKLYNHKILNHAAVITEIKTQTKIITENKESSYLACSFLTSSGKKREFPYSNPYELRSNLKSDIMYPIGIVGHKGSHFGGPYIYRLRSGQTFYKNSLFMNPNASYIQDDLKHYKSIITSDYIDTHKKIISELTLSTFINRSHSIDYTILPFIRDVALYNRQRGWITEEEWLIFEVDYKKCLKEFDKYLLELDKDSEL